MSLSDKKRIIGKYNPITRYNEEDVKDAVKEFKKELIRLQNKYEVVPINYVFNVIESIFGEQFTGEVSE